MVTKWHHRRWSRAAGHLGRREKCQHDDDDDDDDDDVDPTPFWGNWGLPWELLPNLVNRSPIVNLHHPMIQ